MEANKRIKIRAAYPNNLFYERLLTDWKAQASDKKGALVIKRALVSIQNYPLPIDGYTQLRNLKGACATLSTCTNKGARHSQVLARTSRRASTRHASALSSARER